MTNRVLNMDCRDAMRLLIAQGVRAQCVVTSPPYWGLRDYGVPPTVWGGDPTCAHVWGDEMKRGGPAGGQGGTSRRVGRSSVDEQKRSGDSLGSFCQHCGAWYGCLGLEPDYRMFVAHMVDIFDLVRELLADDGTLWMNMGDSYCSGTSTGRNPTTTAGERVPAGWTNRSQGPRTPAVGSVKPKDLLLMPARVAIALQDAGWWVRQDIIWNKPNPMPESVTDRCTKAHEYVYLLSRSPKYFFDAEAIKEPATFGAPNSPESIKSPYGQGFTRRATNGVGFGHGYDANPKPRVCGRVPSGWDTGEGDHRGLEGRYRTSGNKERKPASARGVPDGGSNVCGSVPWEGSTRNKRSVWTIATQPYPEAHFATFPESLVEPCILAGSRPGDIVFDPFMGSGTVASVAQRLGRRWIGSELNPEYIKLIEERTRGTLGMEFA